MVIICLECEFARALRVKKRFDRSLCEGKVGR